MLNEILCKPSSIRKYFIVIICFKIVKYCLNSVRVMILHINYIYSKIRVKILLCVCNKQISSSIQKYMTMALIEIHRNSALPSSMEIHKAMRPDFLFL